MLRQRIRERRDASCSSQRTGAEEARDPSRMDRRYRVLRSLAVICVLAVTASPVLAQKKGAAPAKQYIFSRSTTETFSSVLGVKCVPAYVVMGNANRRGIYVTGGGSSLTTSMGLRPGAVLLTLDNRVVENASTADSVLGAKRAGNLDFSFVQLVGGQPQLVSRSCQFSGAAASVDPQAGLWGSTSSNKPKGPQSSISQLEKYMFQLVNQDRSKEGVPAVSENTALSNLARSYAEYMIKRGNFSHVDPDGRDPQQRAKEAGIKCGVYENLSFNTRGIEDLDGVKRAEDTMMGEPKGEKNHRWNIVHPAHKYVGIGVARNDNKLIMVQEYSDENP
jgi:uncharacterized protein YkwD